jgi:hypothetical protein
MSDIQWQCIGLHNGSIVLFDLAYLEKWRRMILSRKLLHSRRKDLEAGWNKS